MKLYYSKGACSLAVRITLHEIGIACEYEAVNLKTRQTETGKDFLSITAKGAVPVLELDDKSVLTENAAIQQYLADTHHAATLLPPVGDLKRYRVLEWLNFVSTELHKGAGAFFNPHLSDEVKETVFKPNFKKQLSYVDSCLQQAAFLTGSEYTLPDGYLFVVLRWLAYFNMDLQEYPAIQRYFDKLKDRASIHQALTEEGL